MADQPDEADADVPDEQRHSDGSSTGATEDAAADEPRQDADAEETADGSAEEPTDDVIKDSTDPADADSTDSADEETLDATDENSTDPADEKSTVQNGGETTDSDGETTDGDGDDLPTPDSLTTSALGHDDGEPPANSTPSDRPEEPKAQTDGEGYVGDRPSPEGTESGYPEPDPDDDIGGISNPPGDEEMPLADHIEEMILRLAKVLLVGAAATSIGLLWASDAISIIWTDIFPGEDVPPPHIYNPLELWLTRIKIAALAGILAALPWFVYETYLFMRPGLYPNERKYYLASVPMSVVLAVIGMVFSYYLVLPVLFMYFTYYSEGSALIAYGLGDTFNLVITLMGFLAVVFQIPLFIMLAIMMGVTTRQWLAEKRLYFWAAFAGIAFMFTMDPTLMAAVLVALTMILLFEGTLLLLKWTGRE